MKYKFIPCANLGVVPRLAHVYGKDKVEVGKAIRFKYLENKHLWFQDVFTKINDDGYFFAYLL